MGPSAPEPSPVLRLGLPRDHWLRRRCLYIVSHAHFERVVLLCIALSSTALALQDFSVVDDHLKPVARGKKFQDGRLVDASSLANRTSDIIEDALTVVFALECALKVLALGLVGQGSYLHDPWNVLDFAMLITSIVGDLPDMPNMSEFRAIRVLRPLRSLSGSPGMQRLVSALLTAIPALHSVLFLQLFVFLMFGILGIQLFGGRMGHVCRLTEFPVRLPQDAPTSWPVSSEYLQLVVANASAYRCLDAPLLDYAGSTPGYDKESSPWHTPQDCFWPVNDDDGLLCADPYHPGAHKCPHDQFCGSNYDAFGNPRFASKRVMEDAVHTAKLNWGITTYDNTGRAVLTIFQSVTKEGWTRIMYMTMDSSHSLVGACFAVAMVAVGSYFVMSLSIAVISEEFKVDPAAAKAKRSRPRLLRWNSRRVLAAENSELPIRAALRRLISHRYFGRFIMICIFANTAVLSLDHYPMTTTTASNLELAHFVFLCIFTTEMAVKLGGLGFKGYCRDKANLFDAIIVTADIAEAMIIPPSILTDTSALSEKGSISVLRSFRLVRVVRLLARKWKPLQYLLEMIARAVTSIGNFAVLLFLFVYIFALFGMQFFGNTMRFDRLAYPTPSNVDEFWHGEVPRSNFDTLPWAIAAVFQIITGDNWSAVMYDAIRGNGMPACLYFIALVLLGDFILMNLFLALLLDNFRAAHDETELNHPENRPKLQVKRLWYRSVKVTPTPAGSSRPKLSSRLSSSQMKLMRKLSSPAGTVVQSVHDVNGDDKSAPPAVTDAPRQSDMALSHSARVFRNSGVRSDLTTMGSSVRSDLVRHSRQSLEPRGQVASSLRDHTISKSRAGGPHIGQTKPVSAILRDKSCYVFSPKNRVRQWATRLSTHPTFESTMFVFIVVSSITMALETPLHNPESLLARALVVLDKMFAVAFLFEMTIKIISQGFVLHRGAYWRSPWNCVDGAVAISSVVLLFAHALRSSSILTPLLSLRELRALRPLRMISRRPGLKLVVTALAEAIPKMVNVVFLSTMLFLLFSIVAVNFLKGTFNACSGAVFDALSPQQQAFLISPMSWQTLTDTQRGWFVGTSCEGFPTTGAITSQYVCGCWGATWAPVLDANFDNVMSAMLTFFVLSTAENWSDVMKAACDATSPSMQPVVNHNEFWIVFFMLFMVLGSFFVMNVFVGVIVDNFTSIKARLGGDFLLTPEQKLWMLTQKSAKKIGPIRAHAARSHPVCRLCLRVVSSTYCEWIVVSCTVVNTVLYAFQYFGEPTLQSQVVAIVNELCTTVFVLEAALKLTAYGRAYFDEHWNRLDFFVMAGSLVGSVVQAASTTSVWAVAMLVRLIRVTRIFRLVKMSSGIRNILSAFYVALPGLSNIASILALIVFVYASTGVQLFSKAALTSNVDVHTNFQSFGRGVLFLLRVATGESWDRCMHDLASNSPGCVTDPPYDSSMCGFNDADGCVPLNGCGNPISYLFFCSFTLIVGYTMLNLTVAVVLEGFSVTQDDDDNSLVVPELLEEFQRKWATVDPAATGFVQAVEMLPFVNAVLPPLGRFGMPLTHTQFVRYLSALQLPVYEGEVVYFRDVMLAMVREMIRATTPWESHWNLEAKTYPTKSRKRLQFYAHEYFAAQRIHRATIKWLQKKRELAATQCTVEPIYTTKKPSTAPRKPGGSRVIPGVKLAPLATRSGSPQHER